MDYALTRNRKIKLRRGDALGGALPLTVMKSPYFSEMKIYGNGKTRKFRRNKKKGFGHYFAIFLAMGLIGGLLAALLTEGPRF